MDYRAPCKHSRCLDVSLSALQLLADKEFFFLFFWRTILPLSAFTRSQFNPTTRVRTAARRRIRVCMTLRSMWSGYARRSEADGGYTAWIHVTSSTSSTVTSLISHILSRFLARRFVDSHIHHMTSPSLPPLSISLLLFLIRHSHLDTSNFLQRLQLISCILYCLHPRAGV